jgi:hypothetical protein
VSVIIVQTDRGARHCLVLVVGGLRGGSSPSGDIFVAGQNIIIEEVEELGETEVAEAPLGLTANVAPQDWCDPDSSEEELGPDMEYMESYGRVEQRWWRLARAISHGDGGAAA